MFFCCFFLTVYFYRDNSNESSVPHPDPEVRGGQVPRGGECDPAVRDQRDQRQEEAHSAPHRVRGVRGAARHDQAHSAIRTRACEFRNQDNPRKKIRMIKIFVLLKQMLHS